VRGRWLTVASLIGALTGCGGPGDPEIRDWERRAARVIITRDDWGIAHVKGATDADAVFGVMFAQAEDDFNRVETNYLNAMGRLAEAEGASALFRDLRMRLFVDTLDLKARYAESPDWLRALMDAFAAGLNYYLHRHPEVKPRVIARFEPWMALAFTEGSIGGDIERVSLAELEKFYGGSTTVAAKPAVGFVEPSGSNGIAIAPGNTVNKRALLLINPHTSFFFRSELQMTSDEGLNAYGAVTWGQFFVYQGFNEHAGWMHTSSNVDNIDEYLEEVTEAPDGPRYRVGQEQRAIAVKEIAIAVKTESGMTRRTFRTFRTHRGSVVRAQGGKWVSVRLMEEPIKALTQSYSRTKARNVGEFIATLRLHTNSSNNTVYADRDGTIAYFHANFVPKRDPRFAYQVPVDGTNPALDWQGIHSYEESPNVVNPPNGWVYNTNNWPYSAAGVGPQSVSPKAAGYARYFDEGSENPRGIHAMAVLGTRKDFTIDELVKAAYDSHLPAFDGLLPGLMEAYERASPAARGRLAEPIAELRAWDRRWSVGSVATSLAVYWGMELWRRAEAAEDAEGISTYDYMARRTRPALRLEALDSAVAKLTADFGTWRTPWGEINRFQRISAEIVHPFDDAKPSIPVGFTSAQWGSLASFGARSYRGTKRLYGTSGNSFVAVVEFGDSVRARAVTAGGASGLLGSAHFNDQAERYATGDLRPVYFYPADLARHTTRAYRPE